MNPTKFTWTDPTQNVDKSDIVTASITGYTIGVRDTKATGSVAGTYPISVTAPGQSTTTELFSALTTALAPSDYAAAIMTNGDDVKETNSAFSAEITFTIAPPPAVPLPPTGFTAQ